MASGPHDVAMDCTCNTFYLQGTEDTGFANARVTFELSETVTEHIHMPENLYQQRGREEVGWGERERGSGWEEQKGDRQGCREERKEGGGGGGGGEKTEGQ